MDAFDHDLSFEGEGLFNRDDVNTSGLPPLPFTPSYELSDAFSTTFEDPFSYQSNTDFSSILEDNNTHPHNESSHNTVDPDNKLLGFGVTNVKAPIFDDAGHTWPAMTAELYGMFFVAEDVFGDNNTNANRPLELTCYRRNLFQISGTVTLSRGIKSMVNEHGQQVPLYDMMATISALESIEGKSTEIISVPWKTSTGTSSEDKAGAAPPQWPLDLSMNPELDPSVVSIPIAWKRLQFKHATANNGRRKGLQQHYVIQINIMATLATGETVKLAEIRSGPIIVRGRSPRNFDSRKDVPLSEKKLDSKPRTMSDAGVSAPQVKVDPGVANSSYRFYALNALQQQPLDLPDWTNNPLATLSTSEIHARQAKRPTLTNQSSSASNPPRPPVPKARWKSESVPTKSSQATAPIDLSLADDEYGKAHPGGHLRPGEPASPVIDRDRLGKKGVGSPVENADLLYEYFPLSLDDWMPPVDAIYRPHVVHHTIVPPDLKAAQVKNKTKRYFSADD
ncbi:p53-like transcription factor [Mollisia scopiformis]|uniref:p53-like transcription factor n=1 Tax=Mollisia scopiformis TaxID=149040 RepID=A0A194XL61_MOLSC|nr:p53-like transcription factor [Mollisia scopiformis]KUJ20512.1 p53-like transcription factor [Mollisia scopiformis]